MTIHFMGQGLGVGRAGMLEEGSKVGGAKLANTFAPSRVGCFGGQLYEVLVAVFYSHSQGKSG